MDNSGPDLDFYFVPLGREPGGYLDFLGLPPTASDVEVGHRSAEYSQELEREYKAKYKELKTKLDYGQLRAKLKNQETTQDKFDEQLEEIVLELVDKKIKAALDYRKAKSELENGTISQKKFNNRLKKIAKQVGDEIVAELENYEVTQEEIDAQREKIIRDLEGSEITQEEFDAQDAAWKEEKTRKGTQLNKLREAYNARLAQQRGGLIDEDIIWLEMYRSFRENEESFWQLALGQRPLSKASTVQSQQSMPTTLAALRTLVMERDMEHLSLADMLWSELGYTNREFWQGTVVTWVEEIQRLGPSFHTELGGIAAGGVKPEFPSLCEPFPLAIDRLESEEVEDLSQLPTRAGDVRRQDLASLLAALLAGQSVPQATDRPSEPRPRSLDPSERPSASRSSGSSRRLRLTLEEFEEFLRMFMPPSGEGNE